MPAVWIRTFRLVWAAEPRLTVLWALFLVIQGIMPVGVIYFTKLLVDSLIVARDAGGTRDTVEPVLYLAGLTAGMMLLTELLQGIIEWVRIAQAEHLQDYTKDLIQQKSTSVDVAFYESPAYYDHLDQARSEASSRPLILLENCGSLIQNGITLAAMALMLVRYTVWLPLVLLIGTLPVLYVVLRFDKRYHRWWNQMTAERRWAAYHDAVLTHGESAAEVRIFNLGNEFRRRYARVRNRLRGARLTQIRQQNLAKVGSGVVGLVVLGGSLGWMGWRALRGQATFGDVALFYQAVYRSQGVMRVLMGNLGQIVSSGLYLQNLFLFLDLKTRVGDSPDAVSPPMVVSHRIRFRGVTFTYPGSERAALCNFDLEIPAGKIIAIVGINGAGKSTLLKLLCRFYDPQEGSIEIDGVDIRRYKIKELRRMITVLFQFPVPYHATARESILLGDLEAVKTTDDDVRDAAENAGAHEIISRLPKGYDTMIGKWFADGVELSGGEAQRLALARAYFRRSPIIILDEPTSFMDSWMESDWFNRFRNLSLNRTGVIITHRFTIAMRADAIHVMQGGRIVEAGSHRELLAHNGLYAESWRKQMEAAGIESDNLTACVTS